MANGALLLNSDGSFDYTPNTDFVGNDSFTYRAAMESWILWQEFN